MQAAHDADRALELGADFIEWRLDYAPDTEIISTVKSLQNYMSRSILTVRPVSQGGKFAKDEKRRIELIKSLASSGPMLIDVELDSINTHDELADFVENTRTKILVSWHNFELTPPVEELSKKLTEMRIHSNFVKIVTMAKKVEDSLNLLELYDYTQGLQAVIFGMGEAGILSRVLCTMIGNAPFTYASLDRPVAPGQLDIKQMRRLYSRMSSKRQQQDSSMNYIKDLD